MMPATGDPPAQGQLMSDSNPPGTSVSSGRKFSGLPDGALAATSGTKLVIYAAIVFVLALLFSHFRTSLGGWLDWKPNDDGQYNMFKKLTRVSSLLGIVEIFLLYLAWAMFIWACVKELATGLRR